MPPRDFSNRFSDRPFPAAATAVSVLFRRTGPIA